MHRTLLRRTAGLSIARSGLWALLGLAMMAASDTAWAQCDQVARALVSVTPGGPRAYSGAVKLVNTMPFGSTAGIDMVDGSAMGLPHQSTSVHWYKGRIAALHITWNPESPGEAQQTLSRVLALARSSQAPTPDSQGVSLACPPDVVGSLHMAVVAAKPPRQQILMSLFHSSHSQMMADPALR